MREVPQPTFERDIKKLTRAYKQALKDVQSELNALFLTDFERAQIIATEKQISAILSDIKKYGDNWASVSMTKATSEGIASTIYSLGLADTIEDARKIVSFNQTNRRLVDAAISDTQADLLAVTQNVNRQATLAIRKATAEAMRNKLATGVNATDNLSKAIRDQIVSATDVAIIDARGRRWKVETYADMLARTKMMEAHKEASINEALSEGSLYATISRHGATDACRKYEGKVVKLHPEADGDFPYISDLPRNEIFHVNCKHVITPLRRLDRLSDELKELNGITDNVITTNEEKVREYKRGKQLDLTKSGISESVAKNADLLGKIRVNKEDKALSLIAQAQGFDGLPQVVTKAEMDALIKAGNVPLFRGVTDSKFTTQFRDGEYFSGLGVYGNGTYTARGSLESTQWAINEAKFYAGESGSVMRMVLRDDARIAKDYELAFAMMEKEDELNGLIKKTKNKAEKAKYVAELEIIKDAGRFAASMGYDAIEIRGQFDYTVVLNRTALIVQNKDL